MAYGAKKIGVPPPEAVGFPSKVRARSNASQELVNSARVYITFNDEIFDGLGEYNPDTGVFTAAADGYYFISALVSLETADGTTFSGHIEFRIEAANDISHEYNHNFSTTDRAAGIVTGCFYLTKGQTLRIRVGQWTGVTLYTGAELELDCLYIRRFA